MWDFIVLEIDMCPAADRKEIILRDAGYVDVKREFAGDIRVRDELYAIQGVRSG